MIDAYVLSFNQVDAQDDKLTGGKGSNLAKMSAAGFPVPIGGIVTTTAYQYFLSKNGLEHQLAQILETLEEINPSTIKQSSEKIRELFLSTSVPDKIVESIKLLLSQHDSNQAFAVRSSATAEDLPFASFAGQQDTYLNVIGFLNIIDHIRLCWASLFTERAITYRILNKFDHQSEQIAVVIQKMVNATTSGILFSADPVTNNHNVITINAGFGLGEALVSGIVNPDFIRVEKHSGKVLEHKIEQKKVVIRALTGGGTQKHFLDQDHQGLACLSDEDITALRKLALKVESVYHSPQDIEWAIAEGTIYLLQTRPITSLFPIPSPPPDDSNIHLYFSFGHAQMMTEPISPMGLSMLDIFLPFGRPPYQPLRSPYIKHAAGRIYVDLSPVVNTRPGKNLFPRMLTMAEPVAAKQVLEMLKREDYQQRNQNNPVKAGLKVLTDWLLPVLHRLIGWIFFRNVENAQNYVVTQNQKYIQKQKELLSSTKDILDLLNKIEQISAKFFIEGLIWMLPIIASGMISQVFLLKIMRAFGLEKDFPNLQRGLNGNITTEMDLLVGDLADEIRKDPQLKKDLENHLKKANGWADFLYHDYPQFFQIWSQYLARFGMRAPGEIDIARPRWADNPQSLVQILLANSSHSVNGSHRTHFQSLKRQNLETQQNILSTIRMSIKGILLLPLVKRALSLLNNLAALREHPKYLIILFLDIIRKELLNLGEQLVQEGKLTNKEDMWFLELEELRSNYQGKQIDFKKIVQERKTLYTHYQRLNPPRVITSDGEIPHINLQKDGYPDNILCGSPVSAGRIEGIARVILDPGNEQLQPGEILVAPFTDPGWTPLFINAAGVVLETGGLMTHGSVVAREYGLPAVVGIIDATQRIKTGMKIIVDGDQGTVELPV